MRPLRAAGVAALLPSGTRAHTLATSGGLRAKTVSGDRRPNPNAIPAGNVPADPEGRAAAVFPDDVYFDPLVDPQATPAPTTYSPTGGETRPAAPSLAPTYAPTGTAGSTAPSLSTDADPTTVSGQRFQGTCTFFSLQRLTA